MRADRPSSTASMVAFLRALGSDGATSVRDFSDPTAARLLPSPWAPALALYERMQAKRPWLARALWLGSLGMIDLLPLRTRAIDEALREGLIGTQVVILGAGLDGRAYRMPELAAATVFEVDHPATQAYKRSRVDGLAATAREVRFVAVDFERDSLDGALAAAGHVASQPTFWIWEGVIMYLHSDAMRATLDEVAARSAPGSRIAATYLTPGAGRAAIHLLVRAFREPFRGIATADEIAAQFTTAGLRVLDDSDAVAWAARWGRPPMVRRFIGSERLIVAER